jgi:hypothetical protein
MPWEIFRSDKFLPHSTKAVTFVTKSGSLTDYSSLGYRSIMIMVPDYDLGITILVAGNATLIDKVREIVAAELIPAVEAIGQMQLRERYTGTYASTEINSSLELSHFPESGLYISKFVSNGTDVLRVLLPLLTGSGKYDPAAWGMQLVPTLLFAEPKKQKGEIWHALLVSQKQGHGGLWDGFCNNKIDTGRYAGKTLNEIVVWTDSDDKVTDIELPAFEISLKKQERQSSTTLTGRLFGGLNQLPVSGR